MAMAGLVSADETPFSAKHQPFKPCFEGFAYP